MELAHQVALFLSDAGILESSLIEQPPQHGGLRRIGEGSRGTGLWRGKPLLLSSEKTAPFLSGVLVGRLLAAMAIAEGRKPDPALDSLKDDGRTAVARLYNWNLLTPVLRQRTRIDLDADTKTLIVAGDSDMLAELLEALYDVGRRLRFPTPPAPSVGQGEGDRFVKSADPPAPAAPPPPQPTKARSSKQKEPTVRRRSPPPRKKATISPTRRTRKAPSPSPEPVAAPGGDEAMRFLASGLSMRMNLGEDEALAMIQDPQRVGVVLVTGVKGDYAPATRWLQDIFAKTKDFASLLAEHQSSLVPALNAIAPGMTSSSEDVVLWTCRVFSRLGFDLHAKHLSKGVWAWFSAPEGGLGHVVSCFNRNRTLKSALTPVLDQFARAHFRPLFEKHLKKYFSDAPEYIAFAHEFALGLALTPASRDALLDAGVVEYLLGFCARYAQDDCSVPTRLAAMSLLVDLWSGFPEAVDRVKDLSAKLLNRLKSGCRASDIALQLNSHALLFRLLNAFTEHHHTAAPLVYKTLIFSHIENYANETLRDFIAANMRSMLTRMPHIPVGVIVEPLVREIAMRGYSNVDFDLLLTLSRHPRLGLSHAVLLLNLLGRISLNDPLFGRLAVVPLGVMLRRFASEDLLQEFVGRFAQAAMTMFLQADASIPPSLPSATRRPVRGGTSKPEPPTSPAHVREKLIADVIGSVIQLGLNDVNLLLSQMLQAACSQANFGAAVLKQLAASCTGGVKAKKGRLKGGGSEPEVTPGRRALGRASMPKRAKSHLGTSPSPSRPPVAAVDPSQFEEGVGDWAAELGGFRGGQGDWLGGSTSTAAEPTPVRSTNLRQRRRRHGDVLPVRPANESDEDPPPPPPVQKRPPPLQKPPPPPPPTGDQVAGEVVDDLVHTMFGLHLTKKKKEAKPPTKTRSQTLREQAALKKKKEEPVEEAVKLKVPRKKEELTETALKGKTDEEPLPKTARTESNYPEMAAERLKAEKALKRKALAEAEAQRRKEESLHKNVQKEEEARLRAIEKKRKEEELIKEKARKEEERKKSVLARKNAIAEQEAERKRMDLTRRDGTSRFGKAKSELAIAMRAFKAAQAEGADEEELNRMKEELQPLVIAFQEAKAEFEK